MTDPIKRASLGTLLDIIQCGSGILAPNGSRVIFRREPDLDSPNKSIRHHEAEQEIKRRFRRLKTRIEEMKRWNQ